MGLDHRPEERGDSGFGQAGSAAALPVGREESGRDYLTRLSRRATDGLLQSAVGGRAGAQAAGVAGSYREGVDEDQPGSGAAEEEAAEGVGDCPQGGQGAGALQGGQALGVHHRRRPLAMEAAGRGHPPGGEVRWDLRDSHQRVERASLTGGDSTKLQESVGSGARLSLLERDGAAGATDSPSYGGASALARNYQGLLTKSDPQRDDRNA